MQLLLTVFFLLFTISRSAVLPKKVLVLGGNGRVGSQIVSRLVSQGVTTNVLVRDLAVANKNPLLIGAALFPGDVNSLDDLKNCSEGCDAVVSVHGMKPPRLTKFKELLFGASEKDLTHPYNLNYVAIKKIIAAMHMNGIKKFVRLTGSLVGKSPFSPFVFLFNFLLSGTVEWNELAEMAIREAGKSNEIDYTVIRAPEITNDKALATTPFAANTSLYLSPADNNDKLPARRKISYQDVAGICLLSLTDPKLSKVTVQASWKDGTTGDNDWHSVIQKTEIKPDFKAIVRQNHKIATLTYVVVLASLLYGITKGFIQLSISLYQSVSRAGWKGLTLPILTILDRFKGKSTKLT